MTDWNLSPLSKSVNDFLAIDSLNRYILATAFGIPVEYLQPENGNYALAKLQSDNRKLQVETAIKSAIAKLQEKPDITDLQQELQNDPVFQEMQLARERILQKNRKRRRLELLQGLVASG